MVLEHAGGMSRELCRIRRETTMINMDTYFFIHIHWPTKSYCIISNICHVIATGARTVDIYTIPDWSLLTTPCRE